MTIAARVRTIGMRWIDPTLEAFHRAPIGSPEPLDLWLDTLHELARRRVAQRREAALRRGGHLTARDA